MGTKINPEMEHNDLVETFTGMLPSERKKVLKAFMESEKRYSQKIKIDTFNAYYDDPNALINNVTKYIHMAFVLDNKERLNPDNTFTDPLTKQPRTIKIDEAYVKDVEEALGLGKQTREQKKCSRVDLFKEYFYSIREDQDSIDILYDRCQNLVNAIICVNIQADLAGAASLIGCLADRTNGEEINKNFYKRMITFLIKRLNYSQTEAEEALKEIAGISGENISEKIEEIISILNTMQVRSLEFLKIEEVKEPYLYIQGLSKVIYELKTLFILQAK